MANWARDVSRAKYDELRDLMALHFKQELPTVRYASQQLRKYTNIREILIDCCINSCMAYTGPFDGLTACQHCKQPRYKLQSRKPRRTFVYIPLTHRLQLLYGSGLAATLKEYRWRLETSNIGELRDFWDGSLYKEFLCKEQKVFTRATDIGLQLSLDGVQLTTDRYADESTPIVLYNLNLPPDERVKQDNEILSFVIPGPRKYKDLDSYLYPLIQELKSLGNGVDAWDAHACKSFKLRAWVVLVTGDGPAVAEAMGLKRPGNAKTPCRSCTRSSEAAITKDRNGKNKTTYYIRHGGDFKRRARKHLREDIDDAVDSADADRMMKAGTSHQNHLILFVEAEISRYIPAKPTPYPTKLENG